MFRFTRRRSCSVKKRPPYRAGNPSKASSTPAAYPATMGETVYRWVDHTAELELHVDAPTEEEVFTEAMGALRELLVEHMDGTSGAEPTRHEVHASAPDRRTLLAEWLSELVYLAESDGFVPERVDSLRLSADSVDARVSGVRASPPNLVKAVTYHRLEMAAIEGSWHATVVLDV